MSFNFNTGNRNLDASLQILDEVAQRICGDLGRELAPQMVAAAQTIGRKDEERTARLGREAIQDLLGKVKVKAAEISSNGAEIGLAEGRWIHRRPLPEISKWATGYREPDMKRTITAEMGYRALVHKAAEFVAEVLSTRGFQTRSDTGPFNPSRFPDLVVQELTVPEGVKNVAREYETLFFQIGAEATRYLSEQTQREQEAVADFWSDEDQPGQRSAQRP